jgi:hypothetical protein
MHTGNQGVPSLMAQEAFLEAFRLQVATQETFHDLARRVSADACPLGPLSQDAVRIERNFFSTLFLGVTRLLVGESRYMLLYAMVNQGMRAWVTACDNILDDEYKEVFPFTSAGRGDRMRSVLTLLLADRVIVEFVLDRYGDSELLRQVGRVSLSALASSAVQESEEEVRPVVVVSPERILDDVHARKTGDLFVAPLALPLAIERVPPARAAEGLAMLRQFGLACQVLDDIKDMPDDLRSGRHNLLVSILAHRLGQAELVERLRAETDATWQPWDRFPGACGMAWSMAEEKFGRSMDSLESLGLPLAPADRDAVVKWMCHLLRVPDRTVWLGGSKAI